jgi:hypothetical protein
VRGLPCHQGSTTADPDYDPATPQGPALALTEKTSEVISSNRVK